jgi:proline iminopeptidase
MGPPRRFAASSLYRRRDSRQYGRASVASPAVAGASILNDWTMRTVFYDARAARDQLYPHIEPYQTGRFRLDSTHVMYWEQCGNADGVPVLFLHGGPGAGAIPVHRRFFDPDFYRIVVFDQRGAGRSTPVGETRDNTTAHLIADIETLRAKLGVDRWLLFGGSWGSTLALAYAQAHPARCLGLVLRGIFLGRPQEIAWFLYGLRSVFPEAWRSFVEPLAASERGDVLAAYHRRLNDPDPSVRLAAARAWSRYEGACSTLLPSPETVAAFSEDSMALSLARIETHYFSNRLFLPANALLDGVGRLRAIPGAIVQGRYDMVCPIVTADELHQAWPEAEYVVVPDAGHSAMDPGVRSALVRATEKFKSVL